MAGTDNMEYKQVILVRSDLQLPKGKMAAQAAHASVDAVLKAVKTDNDKVRKWRSEGMMKVVLKVADQKELYKFIQLAKDAGLVTSIITDAGRTVVEPGTVTCGAVGPDSVERIDRITGELKMM